MIYDCFLFFNELDLLELRLEELSSVVDKFVLVEAPVTFSGLSKPLYYDQNRARFARYKDKIIHHVVTGMPGGIGAKEAWQREWHSREQFKKVIRARNSDLIIMSDLDEIPRARIIERLRGRPFGQLVGLNLSTYWFFFNYRCRHVEDINVGRAKIIVGEAFNSRPTHELRYFDTYTHGLTLYGAGWDFCFMGGASKMADKAEATSHYTESQKFIADYRAGADPLVRDGNGVQKVEITEATHPAAVFHKQEEWTRKGYISTR